MADNAYCSVSYLWVFNREELNLPEDATDEEFEAAAEKAMKDILDYTARHANIHYNDLEISLN